jgi:hypothetical protein
MPLDNLRSTIPIIEPTPPPPPSRKRGRPARTWTPAEREIIETWDGPIAKLARALGCSIGTAHATLKRCISVEEK